MEGIRVDLHGHQGMRPGSRTAVERGLALVGVAALMVMRAQSPGPRELDDDAIAEMLRAHNQLRLSRGIAPLKWSAPLAERAQRWAEHLAAIGRMEHEPRFRAGQNLYVIRGAMTTPARVVQRWADEAKDYREPQHVCRAGAECGHFTQVIWATTEEVGCGATGDSKAQFWVCFYLPPGNVEGRKPY